MLYLFQKEVTDVPRVIFHCDLNSFFASVELLSRPELRGVPVAVCGDPEQRHGVILAKNEPAKQRGVRTAETIWQARRKCPELVLLPPHHRLYAEYSKRINAIYYEYTDLVEPFGIDESWLDVTGSLHLFGGDARALADALRERVRRELGLTISVGVSFNKVFAKLGSDYKKPDATTVIPPDGWRELVWPLPVGSLLFVGHAAEELLGRYGVRTIGELAACKEETLDALMGKLGLQAADLGFQSVNRSTVLGAFGVKFADFCLQGGALLLRGLFGQLLDVGGVGGLSGLKIGVLFMEGRQLLFLSVDRAAEIQGFQCHFASTPFSRSFCAVTLRRRISSS